MNFKEAISKINPKTAEGIGILIVVVAVVILVVYYAGKLLGPVSNLLSGLGSGLQSGGSSLSTTLGITATPAAQAAQKLIATMVNASANPKSPWSPSFYDSAPAGSTTIDQATADSICQQIWDSSGFGSFLGVNIDASQALAAIKQCPTQTAVSFVVKDFNTQYSTDLMGWMIKQYTSDDNLVSLGQIITYVNSLNPYN